MKGNPKQAISIFKDILEIEKNTSDGLMYSLSSLCNLIVILCEQQSSEAFDYHLKLLDLITSTTRNH